MPAPLAEPRRRVLGARRANPSRRGRGSRPGSDPLPPARSAATVRGLRLPPGSGGPHGPRHFSLRTYRRQPGHQHGAHRHSRRGRRTGVRRASGSAFALDVDGVRRRRRLGRRRSERGRTRGAPQGRQRRGCRRGDRRGARGDRALQRGHRRRRVLRVLRRGDRRGHHDRRPRDGTGGHATDAFIDPATGQPYPFAAAVSSGLSVGVPGTLATWEAALDRFGTTSLKDALKPSILLATRGFEVDETFAQQTAANQERFAAFPATAELFLPGGAPPVVGSTFKNPELATTLREIALRGTDAFYDGAIADEIAAVVQDPQTTPGADASGVPRVRSPPTTSPTTPSSNRRLRTSTTGASTSTAWRRRHPAARRSASRSTSSRTTSCPRRTRRKRCTSTSRRPPTRSPTATPTSAIRRSSTCRPRPC